MWFRYINDVFFYGLMQKKILAILIDRLNNYDPNITFTNGYRKKEIPFFDLKVGITNGNITTDSYVKDTDSHQNIHYTSAHPYHNKKSIVFSQALRLSRLGPFEKDFERHLTGMKLV